MFELPQSFKIEGTAIGQADDLTIECLCDLLIELDPEVVEQNGTKIYEGIHGGHFSRKVVDQTGAGIALVPDVFGDIMITQSADGEMSFTFPANTNTGSRFWDSLGQFNGSLTGNVTTGTWTCAPFDIREDSTGIAMGTWTLIAL